MALSLRFFSKHPGGEDIIFEHGGRDATFAFCDVGHSNEALVLVTQYQIGVLAEVRMKLTTSIHLIWFNVVLCWQWPLNKSYIGKV